ncbi:MAG: choice-of-anchor D domain-containing protein [Thermoanaerobaculaceae bacterium]|nr:choice-of-anchor D domain-containing protein [Thermoanaerobaculaceae bacterium]
MTTLTVRRFARCVGLVASACLLAGATALAADTVTYSYDTNGRLLKADYGGGKVATYVYDRAGNILTAVSRSPDNTLRVSVSPAGGGAVAGPDIACPGTCVHAFPASRAVTLTGTAAAGFRLLAWAGDLPSALNPFTFTLNADRSLTAYFGAASGSTDSDGVSDTGEMGPSGADPAYDGNADGIPDYQQGNAASFPSAAGGGYATLAVPSGQALANVAAVANPHPGDAPGMKFPYGFFAFTVTGVGATGVVATLYLPKNAGIVGYYKYGPTPGNAEPHWYEFMFDGTTGAEIVQGAADTRILLHLVDAQRGDDVLTVDGQIVDAGGPAALASPTLGASATTLDFGNVASGGNASRDITITNTGDANLTIGTVGSGNPLAAPFSIASDTCSGATLEPQPAGATCTITVEFAPTEIGTFSDSFAIPSNDSTANPLTVAARGAGVTAEAIPMLDWMGLVLLAVALLVLGAGVIRRAL